jgi:WD40 repeat protein
MTLRRLIVFVVLICAVSSCCGGDFPKWRQRATVAIGGTPSAIRYSPDGRLLGLGQRDGTLTVISVQSASVLSTLKSGLEPISDIRFLPKSGLMVACGGNNKVHVFSTSDWTLVRQADGIRACDISEDEKLLVGGDGRQDHESLVLWDVGEMKLIRPLFSNGARPVDPGLVQGGRYVAVSVSHVAYLVDVKTGDATKFQQPGDGHTALKIEMGQGNTAGISLGQPQDDDAPTHCVSVSRDGSLVALGRGWYGQPDFVDVWTVPKVTRVARIKEDKTGTDASFSFDSQLVAVGSSKPGIITIYRIKDKKKTSLQGSNMFQFNPQAPELAVIEDARLEFYVPVS